MAVSISQVGLGKMAINIVGGTSVANAGQGQIANPEGVKCIILRTTLYVVTPSTGAGNLGIGVVASGAKGTDILNDLAVNGAITGKMYNGHAMQNTAKTEITAPAIWSPTDFITFTASGDLTGFVGILYVEYVRAS